MNQLSTETVIKIEGLKKTFFLGFWRRRVEALKGLDLEVYPNEIFGFLGPNGAGKTTTIKILLGIINASEGSASILGAPVGNVKVRQKIGFLPEQPYFYDYLNGSELLDFYGRLHGLSGQQRRTRVKELIAMVGLEHAADRPLRKYSKGMLQRIGLAQALLGDPDLVVLDEPMSGLDPLGRKDIREMIFRLKQQGKTIFFSSHILPDVEQICDRVCIVHQGRVIDSGRLDEILKPAVEMVDLHFLALSEAGQNAIADLESRFPGLRVINKGGITLVSAPGWDAADQAEKVGRDQGGRLVGLQPQREDLESYFVREIRAEKTQTDPDREAKS